MSVYCKGKQDFQEKSSDLLWSELRKPIVPLLNQVNFPALFGHGNTYTDWGMLANGPDPTAPGKAKSGVGCCVWSAAANEKKIALTDSGAPPAPTAALFNGATTVHDYETTGYSSRTGAGDNGTEIRARLEFEQKTGIITTLNDRRKIGPYWLVEAGNIQHMLESLYFAEAMPIGLQLQEAQMDQFNQGEASGRQIVWDYVKGSPIDGGHCIAMCGRPDNSHIAAITWRRKIFLTQSLMSNLVDEMWAYADIERISKVTGKSYEGATSAQIEEYLHASAKALVARVA